MSQVNKSPDGTDIALGADTAPSLKLIDEAHSLLKTATAIVSMPLRFPSLSNKGTRIDILKLAIGEMVFCILLLGSMYGSLGVTMTELGIGLAGGNENT